MAAIDVKDLCHTYAYTGNAHRALDGVSLQIQPGAFVAVLGPNGCGKTTLARHFNALLSPQCGDVRVFGIDAGDEAELWRLRRLCGMVFQNPENQFVSSLVSEDVAFGLENYQTPRAEIGPRVEAALELVGMGGCGGRAPQTLSGGQKQRVALAGVLALEPDVLIFDEATSMLDPEGRREVLALMRRLHDGGKTVVMITHYVEEAVYAEQVLLMHRGCLLAAGTPAEVLTDPALLARAELLPPVPVRVYHDLLEAGIRLGQCPLTSEALVEEICRLL